MRCCLVLPADTRVVREPGPPNFFQLSTTSSQSGGLQQTQLFTLIWPLILTHKVSAGSSPLPRQSYVPFHCSFTWSSHTLITSESSNWFQKNIYHLKHVKFLLHLFMETCLHRWGWGMDGWKHNGTVGCRRYSTILIHRKSRTRISGDPNKGKNQTTIFLLCTKQFYIFYRSIVGLWTF